MNNELIPQFYCGGDGEITPEDVRLLEGCAVIEVGHLIQATMTPHYS